MGLHVTILPYITFDLVFYTRKQNNVRVKSTLLLLLLLLYCSLCSQVLCEVEWALESLNAAVPERVQEDLFPKKEKWNANPDITGLLVQDWGVISLYKNFLGDWHLIINSVNKKTACKSAGSVSKRTSKPKIRTTVKSGS
jgi:hypothetical protein